MAREIRTLPEGWDTPIPDTIWPEALISAVRHDATALSSDRVIATIKTWQSEVSDDSNTATQLEAKRMLRKLADALLPEAARSDILDVEGVATLLPEPPEVDAYTQDALELPPKPRLRRASRLDTPKRTIIPPPEAEKTGDGEEEDTDFRLRLPKRSRSRASGRSNPGLNPAVIEADDAIVSEEVSDSGRYSRGASTGASLPPEGEFSEEDEKPTTALPHPSSAPKSPPSVASSAPQPSPPPPPPEEAKAFEDGDPTRHIDLPDEVLAQRADSVLKGLNLPDIDRLDSDLERFDSGVERLESALERLGSDPGGTEMTAAPEPPPLFRGDEALDDPEATRAFGPAEGPPKIDDLKLGLEEDGPPEPLTPMDAPKREYSLAPKPGVIRRRSTKGRRKHSSPRPRAAMHHVRSLYAVLTPLAGELIPLQYERRSRRFWARWREVAGDRGVRRDFIEDLLRSANDVRTLVCELIAEVQTVDVRSVYALVDKMKQDQELAEGDPVGTPDRQRGPLVGASVRVEGVALEDED